MSCFGPQRFVEKQPQQYIALIFENESGCGIASARIVDVFFF